jgi:hypothetical protein
MIRLDNLDLLGMYYLDGYDRAGLPTAGLPGIYKNGLPGSLGLLGLASTAEAAFR